MSLEHLDIFRHQKYIQRNSDILDKKEIFRNFKSLSIWQYLDTYLDEFSSIQIQQKYLEVFRVLRYIQAIYIYINNNNLETYNNNLETLELLRQNVNIQMYLEYSAVFRQIFR